MNRGGIEKKNKSITKMIQNKTKQITIKWIMIKFENKLKKIKWSGMKSKIKSNYK
jgi:hypothetical protein